MDKNCYIILKGGLGNQLFMFFAGLNYSIKNNKSLKIIWDTSEKKRPKYFESVLSKFQHDVVNVFNGYLYQEPAFSYKEIPNIDNIILSGYFQSSKYFLGIDFANRLNLGDYPENTNLIDSMKTKNLTPVILHVRRSDYLLLPNYHPVQTIEYYKNAIEIVKGNVKNPYFVLISDDVEFLNTIPLLDNEKIIVNENEIKTMNLMSLCRYFIIANSSYSWWGAMIGGYDLVIAPKIWFGKDGPQDWQDIYQSDWIVI